MPVWSDMAVNIQSLVCSSAEFPKVCAKQIFIINFVVFFFFLINQILQINWLSFQKMKKLYFITSSGETLPDTVMQAVKLLAHVPFIYTCMYFSKFMCRLETQCKANVHPHHYFHCCTVDRAYKNNEKWFTIQQT